MITKGQFLDMLRAMGSDPAFMNMVILESFKMIPKNQAWSLAHQLYAEYYWEGQIYEMTNNLTGVTKKFTTYEEVRIYLQSLGYKDVTTNTVRQAFQRRSKNYCNHEFNRDTKKEITYFE